MLGIGNKMANVLLYREPWVGHDIVDPQRGSQGGKSAANAFTRLGKRIFPVAFYLEICVRIGHIVEVATYDFGVWTGIELLPDNLHLLAPEFVALRQF